jgi:tRNA threonylcarbamoyladenosine biosynthesis protein TsaB
MMVLGLDTATRATAVAIGDPPRVELESRDDPAPGARPGHNAQLLTLVADAMQRSGTRWEDLDRIAVGVGPGTFTGLRIGIAAAQALALARDLPLVGVSTLQSLALLAAPAAQAAGADLVCGVIDARRGELFAAAWAPDDAARPAAVPVITPAAYAPERLAEEIRATNVRVLTIGDGAVPFRELLDGCGAQVPPDDSELHRVSAIGHCRLGTAIEPGAAGSVSPAYLRLPDAELARRAAQR